MLMQNIRPAVRQFARQPAFFGVVVLVIAIGVGANAAIFSIVDAVLLRPLPYAEPHRLVSLMATTRNHDMASVSILNYQDVVARSRSIESAALYGPAALTLSAGDQAEPLNGYRASASLLGVTPAGVSAIDPATVGAVSLLLILAALAACYVPARRALRVSPLIALRAD